LPFTYFECPILKLTNKDNTMKILSKFKKQYSLRNYTTFHSVSLTLFLLCLDKLLIQWDGQCSFYCGSYVSA